MQTTALATLMALAIGGPASQGDGNGQPQYTHVQTCLVSIIEEIDVPAEEKGVLRTILVEENDIVQAGQLLVQIDDRQAQLQREAAQTQLRAAQERASATIDVDYAKAAHKVAEAEYRLAIDINEGVADTIPEAEVRRRQLNVHRAQLQIEKSQLDSKVAKMNAEVHQAEVRSADDLIERQKLNAPINGVVTVKYRDVGEWVDPGEPVLRVVRMDQLWVEGFVDAAEYNPEDVAGGPVVVRATRARGQVVEFYGRIASVSPVVQAGNRYRVKASVENRTQHDQWLLRPGMTPEMYIQIR